MIRLDSHLRSSSVRDPISVLAARDRPAGVDSPLRQPKAAAWKARLRSIAVFKQSTLIVFAILAGIFIATVAHGQPDDWTLERMDWSSTVEGLETVTITNRYGAVRVNGSSGDLAGIAEFHGMAQYHADDPRKPFLVSNFEDGALSLEITYPNDAEVSDPPDSWRKRRIDFTVYVDKNARLSVETLHGDVVIRSYAGPIQIHSESGDVEIKAEGPLQVLSKYGAVETLFQSADLPTPIALETLTGSILLSLPWHAAPKVSLETRGEISSDYSIDIQWQPNSILKRGSIDGSSSAEPVHLKSNQGKIRLLRRIDDRRSPPPETHDEPLESSS